MRMRHCCLDVAGCPFLWPHLQTEMCSLSEQRDAVQARAAAAEALICTMERDAKQAEQAAAAALKGLEEKHKADRLLLEAAFQVEKQRMQAQVCVWSRNAWQMRHVTVLRASAGRQWAAQAVPGRKQSRHDTWTQGGPVRSAWGALPAGAMVGIMEFILSTAGSDEDGLRQGIRIECTADFSYGRTSQDGASAMRPAAGSV